MVTLQHVKPSLWTGKEGFRGRRPSTTGTQPRAWVSGSPAPMQLSDEGDGVWLRRCRYLRYFIIFIAWNSLPQSDLGTYIPCYWRNHCNLTCQPIISTQGLGTYNSRVEDALLVDTRSLWNVFKIKGNTKWNPGFLKFILRNFQMPDNRSFKKGMRVWRTIKR